MGIDDRGQSETVGVILLTAVVVVLATTVSVLVLSNFDGTGETGPNVDVKSSVTDQQVGLEHFGGNRFDVSDIRVDIRQQDGDDISRPLSSFTLDRGGNNETFEAGDRWTKDFSDETEVLRGEIRLLVIDENNGRVIHDKPYVIEDD